MSSDKLIKHFPEMDFVACATIQEHSIDFAVYDIEERSWDDGAPIFDESEPYLHGYVKWDGCSNWYFDEQDRVMLHGCNKSDLLRLGQVMGECWDWAAELLGPTWQGEGS
jgi:hypothetical protein